MANEKLTIVKDKARLSVIGNSYPDTLTNSGEGLDIPQLIIDILTDLDIDLPDIDPDDWDDLPIVIGLDEDDVPVIEFPDPDFDPDLHPGELPDIIDWPLPDLDWGDLIDGLEDLDIDPGILTDLNFTGLDADGLPSLVNIDTDFKVYVDDLPASIAVVFPPNKTSYTQGQVIDITGLYVYAYKADGTVWRGSERIGDRYRSGRVPNDELIIEPKIAREDVNPSDGKADISEVNTMQYSYGPWGGYYWPNIVLWNTYGPLSVYFSGLDAQTGSPVSLTWNEAHKMYIGNIDLNGQNPAPIYGPVTLDAATLVPYGDEGRDSTKRIIVTWPRPGDGAALTASFDITVKQHGGGGR